MIITVTLNAAIDKTLAVPNFRLGRRHRAVEQTAMADGTHRYRLVEPAASGSTDEATRGTPLTAEP